MVTEYSSKWSWLDEWDTICPCTCLTFINWARITANLDLSSGYPTEIVTKEGEKEGRTDRGVWVRNLKSKSCRCNFGVSGNGLSLFVVVLVFIRPNDVSRKGRKGGFMWTHFRCEWASMEWRKKEEEMPEWMEKGWWPGFVVACSYSCLSNVLCQL